MKLDELEKNDLILIVPIALLVLVVFLWQIFTPAPPDYQFDRRGSRLEISYRGGSSRVYDLDRDTTIAGEIVSVDGERDRAEWDGLPFISCIVRIEAGISECARMTKAKSEKEFEKLSDACRRKAERRYKFFFEPATYEGNKEFLFGMAGKVVSLTGPRVKWIHRGSQGGRSGTSGGSSLLVEKIKLGAVSQAGS